MTPERSGLLAAMPSSRMLKLGLGTAQFGMDYGITNDAGKIPETEACRILARAAVHGIDLLDTAVAYGNAEEVIGQYLHDGQASADLAARFRIITKTPINLRSCATEKLPHIIRSAVSQSCQRLGVSCLDGYLVHHVEDLLAPTGEVIWKTLQQLREEGIVRKIGFSAYEADEIDAVMERYAPDVVQLPFNAVDRRLIDSQTLPALRQAGVEVHARSLFLQGLLLQPAEQLEEKFAPLSKSVRLLDETFQKAGLSRLEGLLAVVWQSGLADRLIFGITNEQELEDILQAAVNAEQAPTISVPDEAIINDANILNPSKWKKLQNM